MTPSERKRLGELIQEHAEQNWWQPDLFEKHVRSQLSASLTILAPPPVQGENYNCFLYMLGLADTDVVKDSHGFLYPEYIQHLIATGVLVEENEPKPGDYILYFNPIDHPGDITHGGILTTDTNIVRSKWAWDPLFEHKIFDVPYSYGNEIKYFRGTDTDARETYFKNAEFNVEKNNL